MKHLTKQNMLWTSCIKIFSYNSKLSKKNIFQCKTTTGGKQHQKSPFLPRNLALMSNICRLQVRYEVRTARHLGSILAFLLVKHSRDVQPSSIMHGDSIKHFFNSYLWMPKDFNKRRVICFTTIIIKANYIRSIVSHKSKLSWKY